MIQFSLKFVHICKSYSKKTKGSRFYGTRCSILGRLRCYSFKLPYITLHYHAILQVMNYVQYSWAYSEFLCCSLHWILQVAPLVIMLTTLMLMLAIESQASRQAACQGRRRLWLQRWFSIGHMLSASVYLLFRVRTIPRKAPNIQYPIILASNNTNTQYQYRYLCIA